jgi:hypothetical protein
MLHSLGKATLNAQIRSRSRASQNLVLALLKRSRASLSISARLPRGPLIRSARTSWATRQRSADRLSLNRLTVSPQ